MRTLLFTALSLTSLAASGQELKLPDSELIRLKPDQLVLAPPQNWVESAREKGFEKQNFIFYAAKFKGLSDGMAHLVNLAGRKHVIPESLVVPIHAPSEEPSANIAPGTILLTWWQSGSGMQRALVVGGTPKEPVVRYLDIAYENPTGAAKKEETLKPGTFHVLSHPLQPGTGVMIQGPGQVRHGIVISKDREQIAVLGFAGKLSVHPTRHATAIPIVPKVDQGQQVFVPVFGSMKQARVTKVDAKIGRVFVEYKFGAKLKQQAVAFGDVALELP